MRYMVLLADRVTEAARVYFYDNMQEASEKYKSLEPRGDEIATITEYDAQIAACIGSKEEQ